MIPTTPPADVHDLDLWRLARTVQTQHPPKAGDYLTLCAACRAEWPCAPRRAADRAVSESRCSVPVASSQTTTVSLIDRLDRLATPVLAAA